METSSAPPITSDELPSHSPPSTTYVQAEATTFKELVQRLTGPHEDPPPSAPAPKLAGVRRPAFKLHERRQASRSKLAVLTPLVSPRPLAAELGFSSPGHWSPLVSPSTQLSVLSISEGHESLPPPTTEVVAVAPPLTTEVAAVAPLPELNEEEEEKAIRERRFYLHPSPRSGMRTVEPELLTLFPLTSPSPEREYGKGKYV